MYLLRPNTPNVKHYKQPPTRRFSRDELVESSYRLGMRHAALRITEYLDDRQLRPDLAKLFSETRVGRV